MASHAEVWAGLVPSRPGEARRRGAVNERALEPLMCGPLLKRGKKLNKWKLRWYTLSVDGELLCYRRRGEADSGKPPLFAASVSLLQVTIGLPSGCKTLPRSHISLWSTPRVCVCCR